ncbi:MAG: LysR family transcriptional regulator [Mesorhizobium sp.]|nr:MAG: LysR family transcriptional regulator [Mesorhizobium sp.]
MEIDENLKRFATTAQAAIIDAVIEHGSQRAAAEALGVSRGTIGNSIARVMAKAAAADDEDDVITKAAKAGGIEDSRNLSHFWKIVKDDTGNGYSLFVKNPKTGHAVAIADMVREAIEGIAVAKPVTLPARPVAPGEHLLVIDLADVHFLKLAVRTETGYEYNREVARHRVVEGTKSLLRMAAPMGIGQVLFVLGNDILHVDGPRSTTTSGTYQDTDGTIFQGFGDAGLALSEAINAAAEVANVDLLHCMSNHDWLFGWSLSQTVAAPYRAPHLVNPRIRATDYNLSEIHRKYYRFGSNLLGFSHGDGAKEEKLYGLMVDEARQHISECHNLYWYLHHLHHKIRKTRGEVVFVQEKDHTGMTAVMTGNPRFEGTHLNIEYVRSPSAPDGWHDRNGYVNRQAVECFIHHPQLGQRARFTEYF